MKLKLRKACQEAVDLVKRFEGWYPKPYICPGGKKTIGYGHVVLKGEEWMDGGITEEVGEILLKNDLQIAEMAVQRYINVPLTNYQHGALVSFTFNLGAGALQRSTLRSKLNRGEYEEASEEFLKWVYASGRKLKGLVRRREAEREMFLAGTTTNGNGDDSGI